MDATPLAAPYIPTCISRTRRRLSLNALWGIGLALLVLAVLYAAGRLE